jgi:hypothetical protein
MIVELVVLIFLAVISIIDIKFKAIPSIFLTGMLFVVATVRMSNLPFGVLSLILAIFLKEADFIEGIADVKVITIIGLLMGSFDYFILYVALIMSYGLIYKILLKHVLKEKKAIPFLPVLFCVYLVMFIVMEVI